jgi:hypothetical protein
MTRGEWFAQGWCLLCGQMFAFDPERVCSHPWPPPDGPLAPICRPCITERVNPERRCRGLPQFPILPGAYLDQCPPPRRGSGPRPGDRSTQGGMR